MKIWCWYAFIQLVMLVAMILGVFILIVPCLLQAWVPAPSFGTSRTIDAWSWGWLNYIYGNPEDGVSGRYALIWNETGSAEISYMPSAHPAWRAYCWSAFRNSADNLKYVFARPGNGPMVIWHGMKFGWQMENGYNVPVF